MNTDQDEMRAEYRCEDLGINLDEKVAKVLSTPETVIERKNDVYTTS